MTDQFKVILTPHTLRQFIRYYFLFRRVMVFFHPLSYHYDYLIASLDSQISDFKISSILKIWGEPLF
jgi:hypothetical protein